MGFRASTVATGWGREAAMNDRMRVLVLSNALMALVGAPLFLHLIWRMRREVL